MINMDTPEAQATKILDSLLRAVALSEVYGEEACTIVAENCDHYAKQDGEDGGPIFAAFDAKIREWEKDD